MLSITRTELLNANIWKYYVLRVFAKRMVWPILTIFLVRNALSATEIGIVFAAGTILGLILEVPSGAIADRIGRKNAMFIAHIGWALSMLIFWRADTFLWFLGAQVLYQSAGSLWSGTHQAFIYETLQELGRGHEAKKIFGKALFISQVTTGILFIVVPVIAKFSLTLPFFMNAVVFAASGALILSLAEPQRTTSVEEKEVGKDFLGFRTFFANRALLVAGLTFGFIAGTNGILADFRQVYLDFIGLDIAYFGLIYLGARLLTGFLGANVERIENIIGKRVTFVLIPTASLVTYVGLFFANSLYGLFFVMLDGIQEGLSAPMEQDYLNRAITHEQRATMLSIFNFITDIVRASAVFLGGITIDRWGVNAGFLLSALLLVLFVGPLSAWFMRHASRVGWFAR